jgi:DNA processing protein
MNITILKLEDAEYPKLLRIIPSPPKQLYCMGAPLSQLLKRPAVAVVGSRKVSPYGRQVTYDLVRKLAEQGIVIISGLAIGVDAEAHEAALLAGGLTIAVLPKPVDNVYPEANGPLARRILAAGGALVSEYKTSEFLNNSSFVARNRIVTGLAKALIVTEAALDSGSLVSADFADKQKRTVFAVPGPITSPTSAGTNNLLKTIARPVTNAQDILTVLKIKKHKTRLKHVRGRNPSQQIILDLLLAGMANGDELCESSQLPVSEFNQALTALEVHGKIHSISENQWAII